jgi:hypothetical protein
MSALFSPVRHRVLPYNARMDQPSGSQPGREIAGLTNAVVRSLERAPARMRESGVNQAAWRMSIDSDLGSGTIILIETGGHSLYRGDGACLGWSQEQLATAYNLLLAAPDEPPFELQQLG